MKQAFLTAFSATAIVAFSGLSAIADPPIVVVTNNHYGSTTVTNNDPVLILKYGDVTVVAGDGNVPYGAGLTLAGTSTGANEITGVISNGEMNSNGLSLTKQDAGNWILSGSNTFSGSVNINGGTLQLNNGQALLNTRVSLNVDNGLTFGSPGTYQIVGFTGSNNEALGSGVNLSIGTQVGIYDNSFQNYTYNGVLSGAGSVTRAGISTTSGQEFFTANNTYTGGTTISSGQLTSTLSTSGTPFGTGSIDDNAVLNLAPSGSGTAITDTGASDAGAQFIYGSGATLFLNKGSNTSLNFTVGSGAGTVLSRDGAGTLIIKTASTDLGSGENFIVNGTAPTVTNGMVDASIVGMQSPSNSLDFLTYGGSYTGFGTATYHTHSTNFITTAGEIANTTANSNLTVDPSGGNPYALRLGNDANLTIAAGATLTVGDGVHAAGVILNSDGYYGPNGGIFQGNSASTLNFGTSEGIIYVTNWSQIQTIISGSAGITISGAGGSSLANGGALSLTNNNNTFSGGLTVDAGGVLAYQGNNYNNHFANGSLGDISNAITLNGGSINANNSYFGIGRSVIVGSNGGALLGNENYASNFSGSGSLTIGNYNQYAHVPQAYNYDTDVLSGDNSSFTGRLILYGNMTVVSADRNLGAPTNTLVFDGGYLSIAGSTLHDFGSHTVVFTPGTQVGIEVQDPNNIFTITQPINISDGSLYKMGAGTLVLQGANVYTGYTGLYGGTLELDAAHGGSISSFSTLFFDGGTFDIVGSSTGTTTENFNGLMEGVNTSTSDATSAGGTIIGDNNGGTLQVNLGSITMNGSNSTPVNPAATIGTQTGTTLDIVATGSGTTTFTSTTVADPVTGIYGGRIVYTAGGDTNFATSTGSGPYTISGLTYDPTDDFDPVNNTINGLNVDLDATNSAYFSGNTIPTGVNFAPNSLKIIADSSTNTNFDLNATTLTLVSGGLLMTGSNNFTISNGTILSGMTGTNQAVGGNRGTAQPGTDLIVHQYGTGNLTISAVIANNLNSSSGIASSTLTKDGPGTLTLTAANTYTGQTFINGGTISISSDSNLGGANGVVTGVTVTNGSHLVTINGPLPAGFGLGSQFINGYSHVVGIVDNGNGTYTVDIGDGSGYTLTNGSAAFTTAAVLNINGGTLQSTANVTLNESNFGGTASGQSQDRAIYLGSSGATLDAINGSVMTVPSIQGYVGGYRTGGGGGLTINSSDNSGGVVFLDYSNSNNTGNIFYGGITIEGGILRLNNNSGYNTSVLAASPANYITFNPAGPSSDPRLQLSGYNAFIAGLSSSSTDAIVENGNGSNQNVMLAVVNGDDETFAGRIINNTNSGTDIGTGNISLLKGGGGSLTLSNPNNSYTGTTDIAQGTLNVGALTNGGTNSSIGASSNAAANLLFGKSTLQYTGATAQTTDRLFMIGDAYGNDATIDASGSTSAATVSFTNTGSVAYANASDTHSLTLTGSNTGINTFAPQISDMAGGQPTSVTKSGPGTWAVTNANTYSGGTTVSGGTLYVNNTSGSGTGTGSVNVASGATLAGSGTIAPTTGTGVSIAPGGTLSSGGVQTNAGAPPANGHVTGTGLTLDNSAALSKILTVDSGTLTFALGTGSTPGAGHLTFGTPNLNSTYMTIIGDTAGEIAFTGTLTINIIDLTSDNSLELRSATPYLLIQAGLDSDYLGLVTTGGLDQDGYVLGIDNGAGGYTALVINQLDVNGNPLGTPYNNVALYLDNGKLEVVPEPATWALLIGGLALLVVYQRRRNQLS